MYRSCLSGSITRAGFHRQTSRVHGSGPPQISANARPFSGLIKNPTTAAHHETSILGNLSTKLSLVRAVENVSLPCALSFRSFIHSGKPAEDEARRTPLSMENVQGLLNDRGNGVYGRQSGTQSEGEAGRTPLSRDYVQGLLNDRGNDVYGRQSGRQSEGEAGRTPLSRDYVQGLLNDRGNGVYGRQSEVEPRRAPFSRDYVPRSLQERRNTFYGPNSGNQPESESGRTPRSMDYVQGLLQERGNGGFGQPSHYQPQFETNADVVHIKLMRNNAFVTVTDSKGNKKIGVSAGKLAGKVGKLNRYSGEAAAEDIGRRVRQMKTRSVVVKVNGYTFFRKKKEAILAFKDGYSHSRTDNPVVYIEDTTRKPHNGCRLPKKRRI